MAVLHLAHTYHTSSDVAVLCLIPEDMFCGCRVVPRILYHAMPVVFVVRYLALC